LNVPPRFRDTAFFDKGENVVIKIPFTGFPKPKIKWYRENEVIESGSHFAVEVSVRLFLLNYYKIKYVNFILNTNILFYRKDMLF